MAGPVARRAFRLPLIVEPPWQAYGWPRCWRLRSAVSGCAVSGPLGSMFAKPEARTTARAYAQRGRDRLGRRRPRATPASASTAGLPSETDLVFARMAIVDVLKRGSKEISAPWENPSSGARGTVTPIASAYATDGATCRDFLASYVRRGRARKPGCRARPAAPTSRAAWEVKSLRPWTRS